MNLKQQIQEVKLKIDSNMVKEKIKDDLNLNFKNNKCLCFLHNENNPSMSFYNQGKFYKCHSCGGTYDIFNHYQSFYNMNFINALKKINVDFMLGLDISIGKKEIIGNVKPTTHLLDVNNISNYLKNRGISNETINYVGLKSHKDNIVFQYIDELGNHVSNKYRAAREVNKNEAKMWFEKGTNSNILFNMDKIDVTKPVIICEGEIDCLSIIEAGIKNVVSIPTGVNSTNQWITKNWDWLETIDEIILWFDNDDAGKKGVKETSSRLPSNNVKIVTEQRCKDANEMLIKFGKSSIVDAINNAIIPPIEHITTFSKIENFNVFEAEKIKSGFNVLDKEICGFILGTLSIITGKNGSGKSTLINQMCICQPIKQGYKVFIFSGELTRSNLKYWITQTITNEEHLEELISKDGTKYYRSKDYYSKLITQYLDDKLYIYDNDENYSSKNIILKMEQVAKRFGVKVFILDNLMMMDIDSSIDKDMYSNQKNLLIELKRFATKYNAVVHLVAHPRKSNESITKDDIYGSVNISNLSDYILRLERVNKEDCSLEYDALLTVLKNRPTGNQDRKIGLMFSNIRKRFYKTNSDLKEDYGYLEVEPKQIQF